MVKRYINWALAAAAFFLQVGTAAAQTPGEAPRPAAPALDENTAQTFLMAGPKSTVARAAKVAYSGLVTARRQATYLQQERAAVGQVADAHLEFYPRDEYLRIFGSPGRGALIAPPFLLHVKAEAGTGTIPGIPTATLSRLYRSDSSVNALAAWYAGEYGFDFKMRRAALNDAGTDSLIVAHAVKRINNSLVTVMIWNPTGVARSRNQQSMALAAKTSVEVQERAFRPRNELIVEGPDAVVELTWKVPFRDLIQRISAKYQIDPHLVAALVQQESNFNPTAISVDSAMGLTQMIPGTAQMLGVSDPNNPHQAIEGGVRYLKMLLKRFKGNVEYALAGYNAGPGNVEKYRGVPPFSETRDYVRRIMTRYREKAGGALAASAKVVLRKKM